MWNLEAIGDPQGEQLVTIEQLQALVDDPIDPDWFAQAEARAHARMAAACYIAPDQLGAQGFARQQFRAKGIADGQMLFLPWRIPLISVTSVTANGTALDLTDMLIYPMAAAALITGLRGGARVTVEFEAGSILPPEDEAAPPLILQQAALGELRAANFATDRDPTLRSESTPDVYSVSYGLGGAGSGAGFGGAAASDALLPETLALLGPWADRKWAA